ncbi:MAG: magnesium transporter CorA family protein [Acidobacteriia bacterium]|nr:magnesium transporter CorA family protein [Terriglobia bacterium]
MGAGRYFSFTAGKGLEKIAALDEALRRRRGDGFIWLDFTDPGPEDLTALAEPLGLHPLAIEDCLDEDQVPKMEEFPKHTFILFNRYRHDNGAALVEEVNFFLGEKFLVTVHSHGGGNDSFAERLEATVRRDLEQVRPGADFLLEVLLDDIVDEKFAAIEALQDQLDTAEEEILQGRVDFKPAKLMHLRRNLLFLRKSLVYEREILVKLCRRDSPFISEKAIYEFRDIYDHLAKFFEVIEICRELIATIMEIHLSMINNQMAAVANKTNRVVRRLTMITTVFMPLTMLAGIGGMSEWSMMTGAQNWRIAYPAFMAAMAVIGVANYYLLRMFDKRDAKSAVLRRRPESR